MILSNFIQAIIFILLAPLVSGIIKKMKSISQKRKGPSIFQIYYDLIKLLPKEPVVSETASWIFKLAPYVVFGSTIVAASFIPISGFISPYPLGDAILLFYLLALGRVFLCLSGLDTGSTFGGMGSSREAAISSLIEPSILVVLITIGLVAGSTSLSPMMEKMNEYQIPLLHPEFLLCFLAMMIITLAETSRIPFDDPATHLELTMVHEAMLLEYSGRYLALMESGAAIKQLILVTLMINLFFPTDFLISFDGPLAILLALILYGIKVILIAILIGISEISTVKLRFFSIPNLAALSLILSLIGFLQHFVLGR